MRYKLFVLLLAFAFCSLSISAETKDKLKKHRLLTLAERVQTGMPDALPLKSKSTRNANVEVLGVAKSTAGTGNLNTRYKEGIDVSRYQGRIDWQRVAQEGEVSYVYIKATEGAQLVDPYFYENIRGARQAGLSVGSYHFYRAHINIDEQLANMTSVVRKSEQDLVPMIDVEATNGVPTYQFVAELAEFVRRVEAYYGKKPIIYTYQNFYNKHLVGEFRGYHWMIAKYQNDLPVLTDDIDYIMWQYTQSGRVPGIRGNVDRSCIMGSHSLRSLQM